MFLNDLRFIGKELNKFEVWVCIGIFILNVIKKISTSVVGNFVFGCRVNYKGMWRQVSKLRIKQLKN
jgi:hypothetical protein